MPSVSSTCPAHLQYRISSLPADDALLQTGHLSQYGAFLEIQVHLTCLSSRLYARKLGVACNDNFMLETTFTTWHPVCELNGRLHKHTVVGRSRGECGSKPKVMAGRSRQRWSWEFLRKHDGRSHPDKEAFVRIRDLFTHGSPARHQQWKRGARSYKQRSGDEVNGSCR